jgi:adenosylcobinamide-GDP ribazoletransferase
MRETDAFLHALRFMTVLPVRSSETLEPNWLTSASRYFPAVGVVVGLASAIVFAIASRYWPGFVPAVLAVAASALLTGALHEDGLADTADGFGGGRSREARLAVMKDSRLGTYGALALAFSVALRVAALALMTPSYAWAALIAAHASARAAATWAMTALPYAGDPAATRISYSEAALDRSGAMTALLITLAALLPALIKAPSSLFAGLMLAALSALAVVALARRLIGGYTGDVLGAVEQSAEVAFLLGLAAGAH